MSKLTYLNCCVSWPAHDLEAAGGLSDMIDWGMEITRRTFLKHVCKGDLGDLEEGLGYQAHPSMGMTMANDYHVTYWRSMLHGQRVYYFVHSAVEYVFADPEAKAEALQRLCA